MAQRFHSQGITVEGIDEMVNILNEIGPRYAVNQIASTNHAMARELANRLKQVTPDKTGNLKKSIKVKRRKAHPGKPFSDVIFQQGYDKSNDGFYWRFVEHGTNKGKPGSSSKGARPFVAPVKQEFALDAAEYTKKAFTASLARLVRREQKRRAKMMQRV